MAVHFFVEKQQSNLKMVVVTDDSVKLFDYPLNTKVDMITITDKDLSRLNQKGWLNDSVIAFYLRYLQIENPATYGDVYFYNSFFYQLLREQGYNKVKCWTQNLDIFAKKYLVIPINENNLHWFLAIIYNPGAILIQGVAPDEAADDVNVCDCGLSDLNSEKLFSLHEEVMGEIEEERTKCNGQFERLALNSGPIDDTNSNTSMFASEEVNLNQQKELYTNFDVAVRLCC